ncbi:hypothetical protein STEG23_008261 [Scotinomys teguina]
MKKTRCRSYRSPSVVESTSPFISKIKSLLVEKIMSPTSKDLQVSGYGRPGAAIICISVVSGYGRPGAAIICISVVSGYGRPGAALICISVVSGYGRPGAALICISVVSGYGCRVLFKMFTHHLAFFFILFFLMSVKHNSNWSSQ